MCGLVGVIKNEKAVEDCLDMLKKLEYRGYDSAGVCFQQNGKQKTEKCAGLLENLQKKLKNKNTKSNCCIGHTRWATHGKANEKNAHPQESANKVVAVVHNGIIENFEELKKELQTTTFSSETDTEVVAQLLAKEVKAEFDEDQILSALSKVCKKLKGSFALAIMFKTQQEKIFFAKKSSPLLVGICKNGCVLASDASAILPHTNKVVSLKDCQMGVMTNSSLKIFDFNKKEQKIEKTIISKSFLDTEKTGFKTFMEKEIIQGAKATKNTLFGLKQNKELEKIFLRKLKNFKMLHIVACGTAYHAGMVFKLLLEKECQIPVSIDFASEFRYKNPILNSDTICFFISQSGETADTLACETFAKSKKAFCVAITNTPQSSITSFADLVVQTNAGTEVAVASTKAFLAQLSAVCFLHLLFCKALGKKPSFSLSDLEKISFLLERFSAKSNLKGVVPLICQKQSLFFVGRGMDFVLSLEGALKLKEITYIHCEAFAGGELKHGSLSLLDKNSLVVALLTQKALKEKMLSNIHEARSRGAKVFLISNQNLEHEADFFLKLPATKDALSPFLVAKALQELALLCAEHKKLDPDKPRNLAKSVTVE